MRAASVGSVPPVDPALDWVARSIGEQVLRVKLCGAQVEPSFGARPHASSRKERPLTDPAHPDDPLGAVARLSALREAIARRARDCGRSPGRGQARRRLQDLFGRRRSGRPSRSAGRPGSAKTGCRRRFRNGATCAPAPPSLGKTIELHLIGPLQSNKAREAVETFDVIETVDREKIAAALAHEIQRRGKHPRLFVEVNTGAEPQKAGVLPEDADAFLALCRDRYGLADRGAHGDPAGRRAGLAPFRAARRDRRAQRDQGIVDGDERGLAARGAARRDLCAHRQRDFRRPRASGRRIAALPT